MSKEGKKTFNSGASLDKKIAFLNQPENQDTPAIVVWRILEEFPAEEFSPEQANFTAGLGLELIHDFKKFNREDLQECGVDLMAIARKTDELMKLYPPTPPTT
ncbi:MAG: hypothetical protein ABII08_03010 [Candidatus Beckwithbacteria bacterium]|nr:hypothetical protein [Patescibacteria group bacterium]